MRSSLIRCPGRDKQPPRTFSVAAVLFLSNSDYTLDTVSMNELRVSQDTRLEPKVYLLPEGITIDSDNLTLDGQGAIIMGMDKTGQGIKVSGRKNITIKTLRVMNYYHGISIEKSREIEISTCV